MMSIGLCFDLLIWGGVITVSGKLFYAFSDTIMVLLIVEHLFQKIRDSWSKSIIVVFTIAVNNDVAMLNGRLVTVEWDLFNIFFDVLNVIAWVEFKELDKVFLSKRTND